MRRLGVLLVAVLAAALGMVNDVSASDLARRKKARSG